MDINTEGNYTGNSHNMDAKIDTSQDVFQHCYQWQRGCQHLIHSPKFGLKLEASWWNTLLLYSEIHPSLRKSVYQHMLL